MRKIFWKLDRKNKNLFSSYDFMWELNKNYWGKPNVTLNIHQFTDDWQKNDPMAKLILWYLTDC